MNPEKAIIHSPLDPFAGISAFFLLIALLLSSSRRLDLVLLLLLAGVWFVWQTERSATA